MCLELLVRRTPTREINRKKFKKLVKKFHPDINLGNKKYEEKLKLITLAYTQLKNTYRKKIDK